MNISYTPATIPGKLRTEHKITIDHQTFSTTRKKEILVWAKSRIFDKYTWRKLQEAVRLETSFTAAGGGLFGTANPDIY